MDQGLLDHRAEHRRIAFLEAVAAAMPQIAAGAAERDERGEFPADELALLTRIGALAAPLPPGLGGLGLGTEEPGAPFALELLRLIGAASLPVGRVFEGHLNALRLVCRYGNAKQARAVADDARGGHLFAVWNTDAAGDPLLIQGDVLLSGSKVLASAAGYATRALVTTGAPRQMLLVGLCPGTRADLSGWTAQGMRASATGKVRFDGLRIGAAERIGAPDDYLRQPDFSAGAWRASAVALGGLDALITAMRTGLAARGRHENPHQLARLGTAFIAQETAALWLFRAASLAEAAHRNADDVVAYVGLARMAVETACLDAMRLAQRSIGLAAFMRPDPIERICRDLGTYLRQPAPDETLTEAAARFVEHGVPAR